MKIAITGTTGRVGRALADHFGPISEVRELPRTDFDLKSSDVVGRIAALDFDLLMNPGSMTSLEACEDDPELAMQVNAVVPGELAARCRASGRRMIHFSTDYVLDGSTPGLHDEDSPVAPASAYARSKLESEKRVLGEGGCVLRVSWVFGKERPAFPDLMMQRALAGEPLAAVADKTSLPTGTRDLSGWIERLIERRLPDTVVHACHGGEPVSWHGMAEVVVDELLVRGVLADRPKVEKQRLSDMGAFRAVRPRHTAMANGRLSGLIGGSVRDWEAALREHVAHQLISR
ncbi:MAG: NAD(P)-dependent oxidoreductase [Verrucomicrobiota bacterium]